MSSSFAAQLRTIALNSTHELDLRARRNAHAESLLFPKEVAAKQDYDTIYAVCIDGFRELCSLDANFVEFERNLFSAQSVKTEREQMNKSDNEALDKVLSRCLAILGGKILLKPGVKCLEWLVRRFRVHVHNTAAVLLAVLPWHEMSVWRNVLSIVPKERCTNEWKFLGMYKEDALNVPRSALVYAMANNDRFFQLLNRYVLDSARDGVSHAGLIRFWSSLVVEAVMKRFDATKSGRKEVQRQRTEDLLLKVLPTLSDGFDVRDCADLTTACLTLAMVLAAVADLDDRVLDSLMQTIAMTTQHTIIEKRALVITMTLIVSQKQQKSVPKAVLDIFVDMKNLEQVFLELHKEYQIEILIEALVEGALLGIKRKNLTNRLAFIERLLRVGNTITPQVVSMAIQAVLTRILHDHPENEVRTSTRTGLIEILQRLNEEQNLATAVVAASERLDLQLAQLEALLGSNVALIEEAPVSNGGVVEVDLPIASDSSIDKILTKVPVRTIDTLSFLADYDQHLYELLVECFGSCYRTDSMITKFLALPIWQSSQYQDQLLISFLLRIAVGPFASAQQSRALRLITRQLSIPGAPTDTQVLVPYVLTSLSNSVRSVRRAAADLLITMERPSHANDESSDRFGLRGFYQETATGCVRWIASSHVEKIISQAISPGLEECVLDDFQITEIVRFALNGNEAGSQAGSNSTQSELKKSLRHDFFDLLTSHAIATPLLKVKIEIIHLLKAVEKVGTSTRSKALEAILETWIGTDEARAKQIADAEQLSLSDIDAAVVEIVSASEKDAIGHGLVLLENQGLTLRKGLNAAFFDRVQKIWKNLRNDAQVSIVRKLFELAFQDHQILSQGAQGTLRTVQLTTNILGTLLEQSVEGFSQMQTGEQPPKKRRRTSQGRDSLPPDLARTMRAAASRLTFALEIIDDSAPETRPELLPVLFDILSILKRLKQQQSVNLPYLQNLCLSIILAIFRTQNLLPKPTVDTSSIKADLITDCIRSSDSPQVQTTALLLSATLAAIAPDHVLHSVMPIFTFMGQDMFSKDDEHTVNVINQAIDHIIPALVDSLKVQNKDLIRSTSSLLASFTAAYDHIPQHRRIATYTRFLIRMGARDFAYIIFAMLAQKNVGHSNLDAFLNELLAELDPEVQLVTFQKTIDLANDLMSSEPQMAGEIFTLTESVDAGERKALTETILKIAHQILQSNTLRAQATKLHRMDPSLAERLRTEINNSFRLVLSTIRDQRAENGDVIEEIKQCLDALLALPSLTELFNILPQILTNEHTDEDLKPQVLRILASQLQGRPIKDNKARAAAIELLTSLTEMLEGNLSTAMKQAVLICIDRLSEVYGRQSIDKVVSAAIIVAGDHCLGLGDRRLQVMSLLCLASMLEILGEACIPIIPEMLPKATQILKNTTRQELKDDELHNAAYALITAIVSQVPFLVSDDDLQTILLLSSHSATNYDSATVVESRNESLSHISRRIDLDMLLTGLLGEDLDVAREDLEVAELEKLTMLSNAIDAAAKSTVVKAADPISRLLLSHLEQRSRILTKRQIDTANVVQLIHEVEEKVNAVAIQFIYKLNDTAFRPIFESWVEWASNAYDIQDTSTRDTVKPLRRTSMFHLLAHFFETLKSIVTSYASYIISVSHESLEYLASLAGPGKSSTPDINLALYTSLLDMLQATFSHDADSFYAAPAHFEPIALPLVSQLKLASSKTLRTTIDTHVVPAIVSLAVATLETPSHHQTLSHGLVQLRHSPSAAVRLASIKTFAAVTADDAVGEDFIANVIGIGSGEGEGARGIGGAGSVGEVMIYVNEMLEDDDEDVEREVRKWVQVVREKTGEDVFEV